MGRSTTAYIVTEYVPGGSLKARMTGRPIPWSEAAQWVIPVGQALAYAHDQGIVHRDVKLANILLARPDWPLLADFGLVKRLDRPELITRPGVSIGTPTYLSPEQVRGDPVDYRSDIYSTCPAAGTTPSVSLSSVSPTTTVRLEQFRLAIGPRLCVVETGATIPIPRGSEIVLGRAALAVLPLPDVDLEPYGAGMAGVSRRHARLHCRPDGWFLEDLQSTNGTLLNETRLSPGQPACLHHGDLIRLGQLTLIFYVE